MDLPTSVRLLHRRAGFGATAAEVAAGVQAGYEGTVDRLLNFSAVDAGANAVTDPQLLAPEYPGKDADQAARKAFRQQQAKEGMALGSWWLQRMVASTNPVVEKLALFWHGHFATSLQKVNAAALMYRQNQIFRTLGSGDFHALTSAVAKDPAMLIWLDAAQDRKAHPNENFARELMELFTLGIGNYTEADVKDAARAFTGWAYDRQKVAFAFAARQHDDGNKTVLGRTGNFNGDDIIALLVEEPASARFIAAKMFSHFARPITPDDPIAADLAHGFSADLDCGRLLRSIFLHPEFRTDATRTGLVKTPIEYVVGVSRLLQLPIDQRTGMALRGLGQVPFDPPNVGGWPQNLYWLSTASSMVRLQFAEMAVRATKVALPKNRAAAAEFLGVDSWSDGTSAALDDMTNNPQGLMVLALTAPEYVLA
jgi:uncharacterized protein (DUF1800 family)